MEPSSRSVGVTRPAALVLDAHGLDLEAARTEVDRLVSQGVLPSPQPSDTELLASLGVDLKAGQADNATTGLATAARCGPGCW